MKRIAIITGASSGMGRRFAQTAAEHVAFDELWVIARREDRLLQLQEELKPVKVVPVAMDLSVRSEIAALGDKLKQEDADVVLLINAAGFGKFLAVKEVPQSVADEMLALNCGALMDMCYTCLPFMHRGAKILNIASVAAFQPVPYITEYAATKAFVLSFSRGLWKELRHEGITVTALCPYWTRTEFFSVAYNAPKKMVGLPENTCRISYYNTMYEPEDLVRRGWRDLLKGRDLSTYGFIARAQIALITLLPHRLVMRIWCSQQKQAQ
ncbi:MAG: SDR family NAD(P)-dependent oxidoreductase [Paludibacteraceae bacterium]|nr:SDR family NAD(P)-dependent oxidoreductase [Paludibacteraceae bacterium]